MGFERRRTAMEKKAIVVGGSIAGLSCAHALITAGWKPVVIEKSAAPPEGSPTGAGLGLDPQARRLLSLWINDPDLLLSSTLPLSIDLNRVTDSEKKTSRTLAKDENFGFRAAHWADLHRIIYKALPSDIILWGHQFISFEVSDDKSAAVVVKARALGAGDTVEIVGDLLIAADGCLSSIRSHFLPDFKLRYSGYSAWRGVLDCSGQERSEIISNLRRTYPELGDCLYFDLAHRTHCVLYELKNKRINWIWYMNMPEPELKGSSVTMKVSDEMIENMHDKAEKVWVPELARVMRETEDPFINIIYDSNPLPQLFWDNVVLVGDAAHPTTPHGLRSTNMSILDAGILGHCLEKWGSENLASALEEFQAIRLPVISEQVLHARQLGRMKQGLVFGEHKIFNPKEATPEECLLLQQRNMPYFEVVNSKHDWNQEERFGGEKATMNVDMKRRQRVVVVGGSIAGLSAAHALIGSGWDVIVIEKSLTPPAASPTGAGLSLDPQAREILSHWISEHEINEMTLLLSVELQQAIDSETKSKNIVARDENFNYRCAHWTDLHSIIHKALPSDIILWGHRFISLHISEDKSTVTVTALALQTNETVEIVGDLLVAADGSLSMIRKHFLPNHKLRYSGYSAWRGVLNYAEMENSDTMIGIRRAYPEIGNCLYFDLAGEAHCAFFELSHKRINWIWYFNRPEPQLQGGSVTMKVSNEMIGKMHEDAERVWSPELAKLMKETKEPFINAIYDSDPLPQLYWDNVVLVGDAAHPTTPHASRSTNMSILDAEVLGLCLKKWGLENLNMALKEYQLIRLPVVSEQVLHSRYMGRLKQGLHVHGDKKKFDPKTAFTEHDCKLLQHKNLPFFTNVPLSLSD
ncbi:hypothetical protein J5N97_006340 [Dioscorea zingiberensis]|uniref:FAD-binding domain-containing protein n=1 Tax=Dioscorea zingiberensis TaxID=325984 RepID=A0A9D5DB97_9LILI|nr:hypothetical protein J5N97_006340 [Dioscorea zingiberensis]